MEDITVCDVRYYKVLQAKVRKNLKSLSSPTDTTSPSRNT